MKKYILNLLFLSLGLLVLSPVSAFATESLTITKVCSPSCTSADSFPFTVTDPNNIMDSSGTASFNLDNSNNYTKTFNSFQNAQTSTNQQPANFYTITENTPSGWSAPSINCGGANIGFNTSMPNSVSFDYTPVAMTPLAQITCIFTNTKQIIAPDLCSNVAGNQSTIPTGYTSPNAAGVCACDVGYTLSTANAGSPAQCVPVTVIDLCSNVAGNQSTIPTGYSSPNAMTPGICSCAAGYTLSTATAASPAQCVPVTVIDLCSNVAGNQSTIPSGYTFNAASGQCDQTTTVTDMCSNMAGAQSTVPTGYVTDAAGNCTQVTPTPTTLPDGCSSAAGYSSTNGAPCSGTTIGGSAGGPGGMAPGGLPTISGNANTFVFLKDLKVSSKGPDVTALQKLLEANGFLKMPKGNAYGYFGVSTRSALIKWQLKNGITPSGNFGPQSRSKMGYKGTVTLLKGMAPGPTTISSNLKVRIVVQTAPNTYMPINAPASTVISVSPSIPLNMINCPAVSGVALTTTTDCSETNILSSSSIKLTAVPATIIPNATFYQWTDIQPFSISNSLPISNACTYSSYLPNIKCSMSFSGAAVSREIQAVYKCNDTYTYNPKTQQCEKPVVSKQTACYKFGVALTNCAVGLSVGRSKVGPNNYTVTVSPAALPSVSSCSNAGGTGSPLQTSCPLYFNSYPTTVTLTTSSTSNGFKWVGGGTCNNTTSSTCLINITTPSSVVVGASFSQ